MSAGFGIPHLGPWDTISTVKLNDLHTVTKYRSPDTGLEVVHAHINGPNVHAYCIIPHKCEDNYGIPKVLNHMIWHGSRRYPHPGLLQRIASKCFSTCPESKAEKDHSSYKFTTAGTQGFTMFLPVFFDHIFNPLLQEAVFIAEVYHIDSNGLDGGTCFSQMKTSENDPENLSSQIIFEAAFGPNSSYSKNHNGLSSLFRSECNLEKVRLFHDKFFHASNCCLVVVGDIEKEELFRALTPVIHSALRSHRVRPIWTKPWLETEDPVVNLPESILEQIEFPYYFMERQIHMPQAHVKIGFAGPPTLEQNEQCTAIRLLLEYLVKGPIVSALSNLIPYECNAEASEEDLPTLTPSFPSFSSLNFVPGSSLVSFTEHEFKNSLFTINFLNVPAEVAPSIPQILRKILSNEIHQKNAFKLKKMVKTVFRYYQNDMKKIEYHLEDKIFQAIVADFLYSSNDDDAAFDRRLNSIYNFHYFLSQNSKYWKELIQSSLLNLKWITVVTVPSQILHDKMQEDMKERIEWRLASDNQKYMKKWVQRLRTASRMLARSPPVEYLNKYPLPSTESIGMTKIYQQENPIWANDTLCNLYIDDIDSNYAYMTVIMDTSDLNLEQKKYLPLFAESIIGAPYMDHLEKFHTAAEFEKEISKDILSYETYFGLEEARFLGGLGQQEKDARRRFSYGSFPHLFCLRMQMEVTKVREGFYWAQTILWNTKWHPERLRELCTKLVKSTEEMHNDGMMIVRAMLTDLVYHMNSVPKCVNFVRQRQFLKHVSEEIVKSNRKISKILESIRTTLLRPENVTVHFSSSLPRMEFHLTENPDSKFAISELFRTTFNYAEWNWDYETKRLANNPDSEWMKSKEFLKKCSLEQVYPMPMNDTLNYLIQTAPGVSAYTDSDYPAILVAIEYFTQAPNGPLYQEVIGSGHAGDLEIRVNVLERLIYFELYACHDLPITYGRIYDVMMRYLFDTRNGEGDVPEGTPSFHWDNFLLQSAKSSVILKMTKMENNPLRIGLHSLASHFKEMNIKSARAVMDAITKVSMKQLQTIARRYFYPLFLQPNACAAAVPQEQVYAIIDSLVQRCGKKLCIVPPPLEQTTLATFNS